MNINRLDIKVLPHSWNQIFPFGFPWADNVEGCTWLIFLRRAARADNICDDLGRNILEGLLDRFIDRRFATYHRNPLDRN